MLVKQMSMLEDAIKLADAMDAAGYDVIGFTHTGAFYIVLAKKRWYRRWLWKTSELKVQEEFDKNAITPDPYINQRTVKNINSLTDILENMRNKEAKAQN